MWELLKSNATIMNAKGATERFRDAVKLCARNKDTVSFNIQKIKDLKVYTYSDIAVKLLQQHLPTTAIENIQDQGYKMPPQLPNSKCFRKHNQRYCAKAKAIAIRKFVE